MVMFASEGRKDSLNFIEETKEFVCNLATWDLRDQMNQTSAPYPRGVNELEAAGLTAAPCRLVKPPRVAEAPCALECKWLQTVELKDVDGEPMDGWVVFGQVVGVHIDERYIRNGLLDTAAMKPIARGGYHDYSVLTESFTMRRPTSVDETKPAPGAGRCQSRPVARWNSGSSSPLTSTCPSPRVFHHTGVKLLRVARKAANIARKDYSAVFHFLRRGQTGDQAVGVDMTADAARQRPTIGLVLGGGAARGFAHIGVIRTLLAKGFTPDIIAGTSIGAVVGGCYAAGKLDDVEEWGKTLTRRSLLSYLDVSFSGSGLISGGRLAEKLLEGLGDLTIDQLPMRYAAIATEIGTGHEIWITRGRLADAMRASYALPGIFSPVQIGERWLMDGALVNPVPVSVARALGARVVIAVNVNTDMFGRGTTIPDQGAAPRSRSRKRPQAAACSGFSAPRKPRGAASSAAPDGPASRP